MKLYGIVNNVAQCIKSFAYDAFLLPIFWFDFLGNSIIADMKNNMIMVNNSRVLQ